MDGSSALSFRSLRNAAARFGTLFAPPEETLVIQGGRQQTPRTGSRSKPFDSLGALIPHKRFDPETKLFIIEGKTPTSIEGLGFGLELVPQIGATQAMANTLETLFNVNAPNHTGIQFQIFGSPDLEALYGLMRLFSQSVDDIPGAKEFLAIVARAEEEARRRNEPFDRKRFTDSDARFRQIDDRIDQVRVLRKMVEQRIQLYEKGAHGDLFPGVNSRLRDYRANVSVVVPADRYDETLVRAVVDLREAMSNTLSQYHLFSHVWTDRDYLAWMRDLLNPQRALLPHDSPHRLAPAEPDAEKELRWQVVMPDTRATAVNEGTHILFESHGVHPVGVRFMSPLTYPNNFGLNHMLSLLGSETSTAIGYPCPFLITVGMSLPDRDAERARIGAKALRAQQTADANIARYLPTAGLVNEDYKIAQFAHDRGATTCKTYIQVALYAEPERLDRAEQSARAVWMAERFSLATDLYQQVQALLSSLPMLYGPLLQEDLRLAARYSTKTTSNVANLLPVVAEWKGTGPRAGERVPRPVLTLFQRRGQSLPVDMFANPSGNYNGCVVGAPGSGKSFLLNEMIWRTLDQGGRVWVIDAGRSFEKLCRMLRGQYIQFLPSRRLSLNPFSLVAQMERAWRHAPEIDEDNDPRKELNTFVKPVIAQMIAPTELLDDWRMSMLAMHIEQIYADKGGAANLHDLAQYLIANCEQGGSQLAVGYGGNFPAADETMPKLQKGPRGELYDPRKCDPEVRKLGQQLTSFAEASANFFSGEANVDFDSNLVVVELEELNKQKSVRDAVLLMLMYRIANEMYLGSRKTPKLVVIDEAWELLGSGTAASFIEGGYRKARKHFGSFVTATHSLEDYEKSPTSRAALASADWLFLLRQRPESIDQLARSGKMRMDEQTQRQLRSLATVKGQYAEVFVRGGDMPSAVGRLIPDPFSLLAASSAPEDYLAVLAYTQQGMATEDAIHQVLLDRGVRT